MVMVKVGERYVRSPRNITKKIASNLPKGPDGKPMPSPGRPKGIPNRISGEAKQMFALAAEGIGGLKRLIEWADENPTAFYTQCYTKLIPLQVQGKIDLEHNLNGEEARRQLEAAFIRVIAARRAGSDDPAVIVDGERLRDITPQLVLPGKTGTDTS